MHTCFGFVFKQASTFEYYINSQLAPRQLGRITLSKHFQAIAIDYKVIAIN